MMTATSRIMYELIYRLSKPRWDDDQVPPQIVQLASNSAKTAKILDLGCGTGTHSIYLAEHGFQVTGVDMSTAAIAQARQKASRAAMYPAFVVQDVTRLESLQGPFDAALDVGCFHGLNPEEKQRYASGISSLLRSGGTLLLWGMDPSESPRLGLAPEVLKQTFAPDFTLKRSEIVRLHGRLSRWYWLKRV